MKADVLAEEKRERDPFAHFLHFPTRNAEDGSRGGLQSQFRIRTLRIGGHQAPQLGPVLLDQNILFDPPRGEAAFPLIGLRVSAQQGVVQVAGDVGGVRGVIGPHVERVRLRWKVQHQLSAARSNFLAGGEVIELIRLDFADHLDVTGGGDLP